MASHCPAWPVWASLPRLFLPALSWRSRTDEALVSEPLSYNAVADLVEAVNIIAAPGIVPEGFLVNISEQVEGLNANIGAFDGPFQEAPEVFNPVGVDFASDVGFGVVGG